MNEAELGVFLAKLSTGDWLLETLDLVGALSPWQILMERCRTSGAYLTDLRLRAGQWVVQTREHAPGYFFAVRLFRGLAETGHTAEVGYKGVGSVSKDRRSVNIIWASTRLLAKCDVCTFRQPLARAIEARPCERCAGGTVRTAPDAWRETRPVVGNSNLIWSNHREGGQERDIMIRDGRLWVPGPGDVAVPREAGA